MFGLWLFPLCCNWISNWFVAGNLSRRSLGTWVMLQSQGLVWLWLSPICCIWISNWFVAGKSRSLGTWVVLQSQGLWLIDWPTFAFNIALSWGHRRSPRSLQHPLLCHQRKEQKNPQRNSAKRNLSKLGTCLPWACHQGEPHSGTGPLPLPTMLQERKLWDKVFHLKQLKA